MTAAKSRTAAPQSSVGAGADPSQPGKRFEARYEVQARLGSGGMGVVYRVFDRVAGEVRALKRLVVREDAPAFIAKAFEREYQVLASLDHPRIISVFDFGVDDTGPYYTMELLQGQDMREAAPLPFKQACLYLRDLGTSLSLLHARRLIHRDLSPGNVRLTDDGRCKLLDFGALADFGQSPVIVGTPPMIAPEVLDGVALDHRVDLYALGALAYWMLTGQHAYPVRHVQELKRAWRVAPAPPSRFAPEIPSALDALVLALLRSDPLARPSSAGEVIGRLNVIAELPPEAAIGTDRLAQSFLASPRFTGRTSELQTLQALIDNLMRGFGGALRIQAVSGMGRSRLLEETSVRAQLVGATVLRVDAGASRQLHGTTHALAMRLLDVAPELARQHELAAYRPALIALGSDLERRLAMRPSDAPRNPRTSQAPPSAATQLPLQDWFADVSRSRPLAILVDNLEYADDASVGILAALARLSTTHSLLVLFTERVTRTAKPSIGRQALHTHAASLQLSGLSDAEMLELVRSMFGDAPNVERFAEWLHTRTAGSPLHAVEICRRFVVTQVIQFYDGFWTLPSDRPADELSLELGEALSIRLASLSGDARVLAECLSLQREQATFELCKLLANRSDERDVLRLLDELALGDVLYLDGEVYRFSSAALRETLFAELDDRQLAAAHRRLGETFVALAGDHNPGLSLEAGWHMIQGDDELRGADVIASVTHNPTTIRNLFANLHRAGSAVEMALRVYARDRRAIHERMPLLAALAQAGYYEERGFGERYGDQALDALEEMVGLRSAGRLRPFLGRWVSLAVGLLLGFARFQMLPRAERKYSFRTVLVHLFGVVTTLTGTAALSLDAVRATRVANVLEPFSMLPDRLSPVGIYQFCRGLELISREDQVNAFEMFETMLVRFNSPRYYPSLGPDIRKLYSAAAHFARASFAVFRAHGQLALESADALDATGWKLYAMIASQVRFLYYTNRGELSKAAPHRQLMELNAAQVGSVWQVETWEAPALLLIHTTLADIVSATRLTHRLEVQSRTVPSLRLYNSLAKRALQLARRERTLADSSEEILSYVPRSFIGWAATLGYLARGYNEVSRWSDAKAICERALQHMTDADREYVSLFLLVDVELAIADAGLGLIEQALKRIDGLLLRFADTDHPLAHGLLHETRARVSWMAGDRMAYAKSFADMEAHFRPTGSPELIARCEWLAQIGGHNQLARAANQAAPELSADPANDALTQAVTRGFHNAD